LEERRPLRGPGVRGTVPARDEALDLEDKNILQFLQESSFALMREIS